MHIAIQRSLVVALSVLIASQAIAGGSKKPKEPKPQPVRALKKLIDLDLINAKPILSNGEVVYDLQGAINMQAITAAIQSGKFTLKAPAAGTLTLNESGGLKLTEVEPPGMILSDEEKCLASIPALRIGGDVLGFELVSVNGAKLGFSANVGFDIGGGFSFQVASTQMNAVFTATDAGRQRILSSTTTTERQDETKAGVYVNFADFISAGFDSYSKTPLAKVVSKSLNKAMLNIANATSGLAWEAPIIVSDHNLVAINAGFDAGVKIGDQFTVQNRVHYWDGAPCQSNYIGSRPDPEAVATVEVYDVQGTLSWARVVQWNNSDLPINPGARVQVLKLAP